MSAEGRAGRGRRLVILAVAVLTMVMVQLVSTAAPGFSSSELAEVRAATAQFHRVSVAQDAGWDLVPGLDHCFDGGEAGAMGYHYINTGLFDAEVDLRAPESLVYAPGPNGQLRLAAVEWIVPNDALNGGDPPTVMGHEMHLNELLGVWVFHAWIFKHNPSGMFEDWNPRVSCD